MTETLLQRFIKEKIDNYVEPQREGTPRGEPIGLSSVKYKASLYILINKKLKEIANELKISYGLLRKWKTEKAFLSTLEKHREEFTGVFVNFVRAVLSDQDQNRWENLCNAVLYFSPDLNEKIYLELLNMFTREKDETLKKGIITMAAFIAGVGCRQSLKSEADTKGKEKELRFAARINLALVEEKLLKEHFTEEDRKEVLSLVKICREIF